MGIGRKLKKGIKGAVRHTAHGVKKAGKVAVKAVEVTGEVTALVGGIHNTVDTAKPLIKDVKHWLK